MDKDPRIVDDSHPDNIVIICGNNSVQKCELLYGEGLRTRMVILVIEEVKNSDTEANDLLTMGIFLTIQALYLLGSAVSRKLLKLYQFHHKTWHQNKGTKVNPLLAIDLF